MIISKDTAVIKLQKFRISKSSADFKSTNYSINILDNILVQSDFFVHAISGSQGRQVYLDPILNDVDLFYF